MLATFYPLIALLPNGKRFYCETAVHNAATGCLAAGYNEWYSIWDNTAQNGIDQEVIAHAGDAVQTANSLEELAEKMGMHIETVKAAFENWDTICDNQEDPEFGKTLFLQKLEPPYYFIRNYPVRYKSLGGLTVSDRMEVLDADGNPIPGLYAAGCTGRAPRTSSPPPAPACCWAPPSPKTWRKHVPPVARKPPPSERRAAIFHKIADS